MKDLRLLSFGYDVDSGIDGMSGFSAFELGILTLPKVGSRDFT